MKNELTQTKRIRALILEWFNQFKEGDQFTTDDVVKYVNRYLPKKGDTGNIKREMRFLRAWNQINYKTVGQYKEKVIRVIKVI